jgi:hypothetical protein
MGSRNRERRTSAEAANAPRRAATAAAATTAAATTTASTASAATAAAAATATTATAAPGHLLEAGRAALFLIEQVERGKARVRNLLFAEKNRLARREIQFLRGVRIRQSRC